MMYKQTTHTIFMVEPVAFGFNHQTAVNNHFQQYENPEGFSIEREAEKEFKQMTDALTTKGINLITVKDTLKPHTPDSIFPNNWISFHEEGEVVLYPMYAKNRRKERRSDIFRLLMENEYSVRLLKDYTAFENEGKYLEGTGSMVFDRINHIAYATISERTHKDLFLLFCKDFDYRPVIFHACQTVDGKRLPVYHTNVMMCIADTYAVICLDAIDDIGEQEEVTRSLVLSNKEVLPISEEQMRHFVGNMLQVENKEGKKILVMSQAAYDSLQEHQKRWLLTYNEMLVASIPTIEKYGGGGTRCMMAEVFLPCPIISI